MDSITTNKTIGYILLAVGLLLIVLPLYQTYNVLVGNSLPPEIFKDNALTPPNQNVGQLDFEKQIENAFIKILPLDSINQTINLIAWSILIFIFIFGGNRIAQLGIKMLKNN